MELVEVELSKEERIVRKFEKNGILLTTHCFEKILENNLDVDSIINEALKRGVWLLTEEFIIEFMNSKLKEKEEKEKHFIVLRKGKEIPAKEVDAELKIYKESEISGKSSCEGKIEDFITYFNDRYNNIKEILKERQNLRSMVPIKSLKKISSRETVAICCMITDKISSNRGFKFLEVEDPTGSIRVLIPQTNENLLKLYDSLLLDEVIGISGTVRDNLFIAQEIFQPDIPYDLKTPEVEDDIAIGFLSDIHVGSYLFLEKEFEKLIESLNLKNGNEEIFSRVKYLIIAGDLVDGIGIYPSQEQELSIPDIYKQYDYLSLLVEKIPDWIEIVMSVGNHDAVRQAEPQPKLDKDIAAPLYDLPNVHLVGNPCYLSIHGVDVLVYHGRSLDTIITSLSNCTYSQPEVAMIELLKRRCLVPSYGNDIISPEKKDYLTIKKIPNIFHCGHVHSNGYATYRGIKVINSGTWQSKTKYQEELGHEPTPGRFPVLNLKTQELQVIHFVT